MAKSKRPEPTSGAHGDDISIWFWLFALISLFIPVVNFIVVVTLAFVGGSRSRKNFFRAVLLLPVIVFGLHAALALTLMIAPNLGQWSTDLWNGTVRVCTDAWAMILDLLPQPETKD